MKSNTYKISSLAFMGWLCVAAMPAWSEPQDSFSPEFYTFSNGLKSENPEQGVRLIKELGYQGIGSVDPKRLKEFKAECDKEGLKIFSVYLGGKVNADDFSYGKDVSEAIQLLKGSDSLIEVNVQRGNKPNDEQAIAMIKEIAEKAKEAELKVVIYPHANFHIERIDHALKIAKATGCDNVGVAFNLCHFLKVQPNEDLSSILAEAKPLLWSVSICGADTDGKDWDALIRPLDEGTFNQATLLKRLREIEYPNSIGLQCYNIRIDPKQNLTRSIQAWKKHLAASKIE